MSWCSSYLIWSNLPLRFLTAPYTWMCVLYVHTQTDMITHTLVKCSHLQPVIMSACQITHTHLVFCQLSVTSLLLESHPEHCCQLLWYYTHILSLSLLGSHNINRLLSTGWQLMRQGYPRISSRKITCRLVDMLCGTGNGIVCTAFIKGVTVPPLRCPTSQ